MTNSTAADTTAPEAGQRQRLIDAARPLRRKPASSSMERWLLLGGCIVLPLGLVMIIFGYWGAAHTSRVIQQIPYEISGGFLGLAFVFAGGFSYFAWWMTTLVREQRALGDQVARQTATLSDALARIESHLATPTARPMSVASSRTRERTAVTARTTPAPALVPSLVATPTGSLVHRPDCPVVAHRGDIHRVKPTAANLKPCRICAPDLPAKQPTM
jgi:hypothetical protein